jgi:predicted ThiF/HesA family dinucleotide-utilizing enzyme
MQTTICSAHYYLRPVDVNSAVELTEDTSPHTSTNYGFKDVSSTGLIVDSTEVRVSNNDELNGVTTDAVNYSRERVEDQEHIVLETGEIVNDSSHVPALTKEGILQRLALLYSQNGLSLNVLGGVAKLVKDLGHDIPTDP